MPKFNADAAPISAPLEITLNSKVYVIETVMPETLDEIAAIARDADAGGTPIAAILSRQMAILTGKEPDEFANIDVRKLTAALEWITNQITNPTGRAAAAKK